jgi:hypothetical protein
MQRSNCDQEASGTARAPPTPSIASSGFRSLQPACATKAGIAAQRGFNELATELLNEAISQLEGADMLLYAAAARRRLGELIGGKEGASHIHQADTLMTDQTFRNPIRATAMLAPGFPIRTFSHKKA